MKGVLLALATIIVWSILNVVNRYCVLRYDADIMVFTSFMIFATGVSLLLIRQPVKPEQWNSGVKYSWLYTVMQILRSFFMISTFVYITSTETSLLFNIEIVITYLMAFLIFHRIPQKGAYAGIIVIILGFILFIFSLPAAIRSTVSLLVIASAIASCIRSIVVEETTIKDPHTTVRQKCGISGYTMFIGGLALIGFFFVVSLVKYFAQGLPSVLHFLDALPSWQELTHPPTIISACIAGLAINAFTTYFYYATLKYSTSESFMAVRSFQPVLTYVLEVAAALSYTAMRPQLNLKDYLLGGVIILGSLLILFVPSIYKHSKDFIAD